MKNASPLKKLIIVAICLILLSGVVLVPAASARGEEQPPGTVQGATIPTLLSPKGTITFRQPTYQWTSVTGATIYQLQVYQGATLVVDQLYDFSTYCTSSTCSATPAVNLGYLTYQWRVRAYVSGAWKAYSAWQNFTVSNVPVLQSPKGIITSSQPTYQWSRVSYADFYQIQLYRGLTKIFEEIYSSSVCTASTCSITPSLTLNNLTYKWRARAFIGLGWKPFSAYQTFTVTAPVGGFNSQFTSNANGWDTHTGKWKLESSNYYTTTGVAGKAATISYDDNYSTLTFEARMKRSGCPGCVNVLIIRGKPNLGIDAWGWWYKEYTFDYTNSGLFSVWKDYYGDQEPLKGWTISKAINKDGWNTLKVVASGTKLKFYINGDLVWIGYDSAYSSGKVGIGMYRSWDYYSNEKLWVDWAKLTPAVADIKEADEMLLAGEEVPGGDHNMAPEVEVK